jgi:hypothetical protein
MDEFILMTEETGPAFIGGTVLNNKFVPPAPYESWIFDENYFIWKSPVPYPEDNGVYSWDEESLSWILLNLEITEEGTE